MHVKMTGLYEHYLDLPIINLCKCVRYGISYYYIMDKAVRNRALI